MTWFELCTPQQMVRSSSITKSGALKIKIRAVAVAIFAQYRNISRGCFAAGETLAQQHQ